MDTLKDILHRARDSVTSAGAFSQSDFAGGPLDLHAHIASAISKIPSQYQPPKHWYVWTPGKSPMSTGASRLSFLPARCWPRLELGIGDSLSLSLARGERKKMGKGRCRALGQLFKATR